MWQWFLPRDYAVARCSSVCPSHAGILSKRLRISSNLFSLHTILAFPHQTVWQYYDRTPLTGASNAGRAGMNNRDFRPISHSISEMIQDRAIVTIIGTYTRPTQECHFEWSCLSDLEWQWQEASCCLSATAFCSL